MLLWDSSNHGWNRWDCKWLTVFSVPLFFAFGIRSVRSLALTRVTPISPRISISGVTALLVLLAVLAGSSGTIALTALIGTPVTAPSVTIQGLLGVTRHAMRLSAPSIIALFDGGFVKGGFRIDIAPSYANSLLPMLRLIPVTLGTVHRPCCNNGSWCGCIPSHRYEKHFHISTSRIVDKNGWWLLTERARICCPPLPYGLIGRSLLPSCTARSSDLGWLLRQCVSTNYRIR